MIVRKTFFVLIIMLLASVLIAYLAGQFDISAGGQNSYIYLRLIIFFLLLIVVSWVWAKQSLHRLSIKRSARILRQQVGQIFEERFEITNESGFGKLWLQIDDESDIPDKKGSKVVSRIGKHSHRSYISRTFLSERGVFLLGPTRLRSGDPFGIFAVEQEFPGDRKLLVLPYMVELAYFPTPPGVLPGGRALRRRSAEVTPYAAGVREYAPGDPLNRIHWKSTARKDRIMVKEFEQDPLADIWIFVDAFEYSHLSIEKKPVVTGKDSFWIWSQKLESPLPPSTFEYAVSIAASISNYYIHQGRAVGFAASSTLLNVIQAERGERQMGKILEHLALINCDGKLPLVGLIEGQAAQIPKGSTVVLITSSTDQSVELAVTLLMKRDLRPIVVFIDPATFGSLRSAEEISTRISAYDVPVKVVRCDQDLRTALEFQPI